MKEMRLGFIGFGNMGSAIAEGLITKGGVSPSKIYATGARFEKCFNRCQELGGAKAVHTIEEVCEQADILFLSVKPNMVPTVLEDVREKLHGKILISIVWGYDFEKLSQLVLEDTELLCTCPNTPVAVGKGIFVVEKKHSLKGETYALVEEMLSKISKLVLVEGKQMDIAGTVSACAPAFAEIFLEALGDAGVMHGLPRETAYSLASAMLEGTAALQQETKMHPGAMKDAVCSPGGATIKGVAKLEEKGFRSAVISAVSEIQRK